MTAFPYRSARPEDDDVNGVEELAEFAVLVARSSLGAPQSLDNQRLGQELCERYEVLDAGLPALEGDRLFAVARHLHTLGLHGFAELTFRDAARRGSAPAAAVLAGLLDDHGPRRPAAPVSSTIAVGQRNGPATWWADFRRRVGRRGSR